MRASKRYSVTALYLSMNANQRDMEIEDDLARGERHYMREGDAFDVGNADTLQPRKPYEI